MNNATLRTGCAIHILGTCKRGSIQCIHYCFGGRLLTLLFRHSPTLAKWREKPGDDPSYQICAKIELLNHTKCSPPQH